MYIAINTETSKKQAQTKRQTAFTAILSYQNPLTQGTVCVDTGGRILSKLATTMVMVAALGMHPPGIPALQSNNLVSSKCVSSGRVVSKNVVVSKCVTSGSVVSNTVVVSKCVSSGSVVSNNVVVSKCITSGSVVSNNLVVSKCVSSGSVVSNNVVVSKCISSGSVYVPLLLVLSGGQCFGHYRLHGAADLGVTAGH
ncbi:hypothetical protein ACOMHN_049582 [Nucella lapillus]